MSRAVILGRPVSGQFASEPSAWRKALVVAALPVALFVAVVVQLTVVNRLPLPGGTAPDLVLLLVTAVAVSTSPMTGLLTGFAGGLALDIAPPATHYAGEYALVFCLVGYFAARIAAASAATTGERNPWVELGVMAAAAAAGEAGKAGLGLLLSDPNVTGPAIKHVLPGAIAWDLLLTPFAFLLVSWVAGLARPVAERAPRPEFVGAQRLAAVFRLASAGAAPNLRLAGTGAKFTDARPRAPGPEAAPGRRQIKIVGPNGPGRLWHRPARPGRRADRQAELRALRQRPPTGGRPRPPRPDPEAQLPAFRHRPPVGQRRRPSRPDPEAQLRRQVARDHPAPPPEGPGQGLDPRGDRPGSRRPAASGARARAGSAPAAAPAARLGTGAGPVAVAGRRSPKAGWLRTDAHRPPAAANRARPGKGWLRTSRRPRANWYSSGPSTRWVRRSRSKDRWRTRRRSLSGALLSGVRDLLPSGDRR